MCRSPRWRSLTAASRVFVTISRGSLPGTYVVMNATLVPVSGTTGIGSRATRVACALDSTFMQRKNSIRPIETSITMSSAGRKSKAG